MHAAIGAQLEFGMMCILHGWADKWWAHLVQAPPFVSQSLSRPQQGVDRVKHKLAQTRLGHQQEVPACQNVKSWRPLEHVLQLVRGLLTTVTVDIADCLACFVMVRCTVDPVISSVCHSTIHCHAATMAATITAVYDWLCWTAGRQLLNSIADRRLASGTEFCLARASVSTYRFCISGYRATFCAGWQWSTYMLQLVSSSSIILVAIVLQFCFAPMLTL